MHVPDYKTVKYEQQLRIDEAATARVVNQCRRDARAVRMTRYRSAVRSAVQAISSGVRRLPRALVPQATG